MTNEELTQKRKKPERKKFDPSWPFPQYDAQGKRLLPPKQKRKPKDEVLLAELGKAPV